MTGYDYTPSTGRAPLNGIQGDREVSGREISEERDGYANENEETIDVFRHEKPMKMIKPHSEEPKNIEVDSKVVPSTVSANKDRDDVGL